MPDNAPQDAMAKFVEEFTAFQQQGAASRFSPSACVLYMAILGIALEQGWPDEVTIPNNLLLSRSGMRHRSTMYRAREELQRGGLISCTATRGIRSVTYTILGVKNAASAEDVQFRNISPDMYNFATSKCTILQHLPDGEKAHHNKNKQLALDKGNENTGKNTGNDVQSCNISPKMYNFATSKCTISQHKMYNSATSRCTISQHLSDDEKTHHHENEQLTPDNARGNTGKNAGSSKSPSLSSPPISPPKTPSFTPTTHSSSSFSSSERDILLFPLDSIDNIGDTSSNATAGSDSEVRAELGTRDEAGGKSGAKRKYQKRYIYEPIDVQLVHRLRDIIRSCYPYAGERWDFAGDIHGHYHMMRLLRENGNGEAKGPISVDRIERVLDWLENEDDFWIPQGNIRSVSKFRKQFSRLEVQASNGNGKKRKSGKSHYLGENREADYARRAMDDLKYLRERGYPEDHPMVVDAKEVVQRARDKGLI